MMAALRFIGLTKAELPSDLYFVVSTAGETGRHDSLAYVLDHGNVTRGLVHYRRAARDSTG